MDLLIKQSEAAFEIKNGDSEFEARVQKLRTKLQDVCPDGNINYFQQIFRIFAVPYGHQVRFPSRDELMNHYADVFTSFYIFRFKNVQRERFTHGIFISVKGYAPRGAYNSFVSYFIEKFMFDGQQTEIQAVLPRINSIISITDYLQQQYVVPSNLYLNFTSKKDAISARTPSNINHQQVTRVNQLVLKDSQQILTNILNCPEQYQSSYLFDILHMEPRQFRIFMRETTLSKITFETCSFAYNLSLQSQSLSKEDVAYLMDPLTKRGLISRLMTTEVQTQIRYHLNSAFQDCFVHPSPLVLLNDTSLQQNDVFDVILLDPRFLMQLIMCARWFAKVCLRNPEDITNNQAHLLLYGQSGAGKSFILSIFSKFIPTYRYLTTGNYQNPEIFNSALLHLDEFDTNNLVNNQYKALLDIKSAVKIDQKNLHPENGTKDMPCIISTNDEVLSNIKGTNRRGRHINQASVDAAIRRLYIVPFKGGIYDKLHGKLEETHSMFALLNKYNDLFQNESNKIERLFNFIMAFAMFQTDAGAFQLPLSLQQYIRKVVEKFSQTLFGCFYLKYKKFIDGLTRQIEGHMTTPDINDTEYQTQVTLAIGELRFATYKFIKSTQKGKGDKIMELVKDDSVPWPIRIYYTIDTNKIEVPQPQYRQFLNQSALHFIQNEDITPYQIDTFTREELIEQKQIEEIECDETLPKVGDKRKRSISFNDIDPEDFLRKIHNEDEGYISDLSTKKLWM